MTLPKQQWLAATALGLLVAVASSPARADLSSWLYTGAGWATGEQRGNSDQWFVLDLHTGMGTTPSAPISVGGVFKMPIHFGGGVDLGLAGRLATRGYNQGDFGLAVDLGAYQRWWGGDSTGYSGALVLGAPLGLTLSAGGLSGSHDTRELTLSIGIDFARLTAHRSTGTGWWQNIVLPHQRSE